LSKHSKKNVYFYDFILKWLDPSLKKNNCEIEYGSKVNLKRNVYESKKWTINFMFPGSEQKTVKLGYNELGC
jgi:hypothetical protein